MAVSASGLASMRSKPVKASNNPTASKARFRRPSVTCRTTSASRSRSTASLVDLKVRPMCAAAVVIENTGRDGRASRSRSAAESARTLPSRARASCCQVASWAAKCSVSAQARPVADRNSSTQSRRPCGARGVGPGAVEGVDVGIGPGGQDEADGRLHAGGDAAPAKDELDQCPAGAPVAVSERVDRLELAVRQGGLQKGGVVVACEIGGQVVQQARDFISRVVGRTLRRRGSDRRSSSAGP